ncbi:MAG: hypothetical protein V1862_08780 [Methanobacteriota archaeon]
MTVPSRQRSSPVVVVYLDHVINYLRGNHRRVSVLQEDDPDTIARGEPAARDLGRQLV